eukprot:12420326-Karenia_brevis.AAC.1
MSAVLVMSARSESESALLATFRSFAWVMSHILQRAHAFDMVVVVYSDRAKALPRVVTQLYNETIDHVLCVQHIKENVGRNAQNIHGVDDS